MARQARQRSETGIYHIMLKGIDDRNIFLEYEDKTVFLEKLVKIKETVNFKLFGYCLMDNHVHLLMEESEEIGTSIKRITVSYVHWHNNKYGRKGHLFQNRYLSEPVESEKYLLAVLRYIHQNPLKAMIVERLEDYKWSSYNQYILLYYCQKAHIDGELIISSLGAFDEFQNFMKLPDNQKFIEYSIAEKYSDEKLRKIIHENFFLCSISDLPMEERGKKIKEIYRGTGASIRQLGRVLGVGKGVVEKAIR
ncbi:MAG: transposase [Bacillota bacterium]